MNKELVVNTTTLADTIRDQVRKTIAATIPDEQINGLIKTEYDNFFRAGEKRYHSDPTPISPFQALIAKEMDAFLSEKIREHVRKECERFTSNQWSDEGKKIVERFVKEYAPLALAGISDMIVRNAMQAFQNGQRF